MRLAMKTACYSWRSYELGITMDEAHAGVFDFSHARSRNLTPLSPPADPQTTAMRGTPRRWT